MADSTGTCRVVFYQKEVDQDPKAFRDFEFQENIYCKVYGTYRMYKEEVVVVGIHIEQIKQHNEIVNHLMRTFVSQQERVKGAISTTKLRSAGGRDDTQNDEKRNEEIVHEEIKRHLKQSGDQFFNTRQVYQRCQGKMPQSSFSAAIDSLEKNGDIYPAGDADVYGYTN